MTIKPTQAGQTAETRTGTVRGTPADPSGAKASKDRKAEIEAARPDRAEISDAARDLQQNFAIDRGTLAQLGPDRMRQVLERLADGHYDRPEVCEEILRRLSDDLGSKTGI